MNTRILQCAVLGTVLFVASAMPASAQSLGVGVSFLDNSGGTGAIVDYSMPFKSTMTEKALGWVGEFSIFHKQEGNVLAEASVNTMMFQGGVRMSGEAGEKATWLAQGLVGVAHASGGVSILGVDLCEDGGCSDNTALLTIGGGIQYAMSEKAAVRGQLDFPIALNGDGHNTRFSIMLVLNRAR